LKASRKKANNAIYALTANKYFNAIPLDALFAACEAAGYGFEPENIACILCGAEGRATWTMYDAATIPGYLSPTNAMLVLTWYKMPSGRYEVVSYVS
jgi:hypothetical protein